MADDAKRAAYAAKLDRLIDRADRLGAREVKTLLALLREARRDALDSIATEWGQAHYTAIIQRIERTMVRLGKEMRQELAEAHRERFDRGLGEVDGMVLAYDGNMLKVPPPLALSREVLQTLESFTADLITDVSQQVIKNISAELALGTASNQSQLEIMKRIATKLVDSKGRPVPGIWGDTLTRAEVISRTEGNRVQSLAQQQRLEQWTKERPGLMKTWKHSLDNRTRASHRRAGQDYMPGGDPGPIPVDQPFVLRVLSSDAEASKRVPPGEYEGMYPRDPRFPAALSVQCRCASGPWREEWAE